MQHQVGITHGLLVALALVSAAEGQELTVPTSVEDCSSLGHCSGTALERACALEPPKPKGTLNAEFEGHDFWEANDALLSSAWREYGHKHATLYTFNTTFEELYLTEALRTAVNQARSDRHDETAARALFTEITADVPGSTALFNPLFLEHLLEEIEHLQRSGIPQRRPNGMNRFGAILGDIGFEPMLDGLVQAYLAPLAAMHFPEAALASDIDHHYSFLIRYKNGEDTKLAEHTDASVITMNLCLGHHFHAPDGDLSFQPYTPWMEEDPDPSRTSTTVNFQPGTALFHHGQHRHAAKTLVSGERVNLIVWLHAKYGTVRMKAYQPHDQMDAAQRWGSAVLSRPSFDHEL